VSAGALAAVDLGASSGRVIVGRVADGAVALEEVHRFANDPVALPDGLHWDILGLYRSIVDGLRRAGASAGDLAGIAVDSWGVDYGLLDASGALVGIPFHYRDARTDGVAARLEAAVPRDELYSRTGTQFLAFNTLYQLTADAEAGRLRGAATMALVPDLVGYWLTGTIQGEATNASTTGLFDPGRRAWDRGLVERLGLPPAILGAVAEPGDPLGPVRASVTAEAGLPAGVLVSHVGSHDTASAVVAVPMADERAAYVACGTWGLVGLELEAPIRDERSQAANFTNELGVDGRIRFLRNVMGLWLLQESLRTWERAGRDASLGSLLAAAAELPPGGPVFDPNDPSLLPPGDMPSRISELVVAAGAAPLGEPVAVVRSILDSLATAFAAAVRDAARIAGRDVDVVHVVGGGSQNTLLCQLTADALGLPVVAGPVEATAIGNLLVQARAHGMLAGGLADLRAVVRRSADTRRYEPRTTRKERMISA
jgi:rhamnulokinase